MAQLKDLIVTGSSRFLNDINGNITGSAAKLGTSNVGSATKPMYLNAGVPTECTYTLEKSVPSNAVFTDNDTKNTAGSTDTSSKIFLIGATSQAANPQTYSHDTAYVGTDGCLYSGGNKVLTSAPVTSVAGKTGAVTLTASDVGALASSTKYAGASTAGGSATSAAKLDTATAGSATQPCYFASGVPSACTYSLNKTVPSDAVFTDTKVTSVDNHYTPTAASASKITITSTGGYPKKIEISRDSKGHVTAATVTETEVIPDNDFNVTQTATDSGNSNYELLFSGTADNTTRTEGARKTQYFKYNPSSKAITIGTRGTNVVGDYSIAIGSNVDAKATSTFAVGNYAIAEGNYSAAIGLDTNARYRSQFVFGEYNISDSKSGATIPTDRGNYVEIVGNGTATTASNARTLDWDGNEWLAGKLYSKGVVAQSSGTENVRVDYYQISVNDTQESHTALWIHSDDIVLPDVQIDQEVYENTWDGVNNSLKAVFQHTPYMDTSGAYPWLKAPGNVANWIKVGSTSSTNYFGIIPAQAGGLGSGHSSVGTSDYAFSQCYIENINSHKITLSKNSVTTTISSENTGYVHFACTKPFSFNNAIHLTGTDRNIGSTTYRCSNIYTNAVNSAGLVTCKGNMNAGYAMHGNGTGHTYACEWGSNLAFWVDVTKVATVSDRRLKHDIEEVNWDLVRAIAECKTYQYKAFNRNGLISVGIIAQDLVANCEKYGIDPLEYELLDMEQFIADDSTLYYHLEYEQYLTFKSLWLQHQIDELKELIENK